MCRLKEGTATISETRLQCTRSILADDDAFLQLLVNWNVHIHKSWERFVASRRMHRFASLGISEGIFKGIFEGIFEGASSAPTAAFLCGG